MQRESQIGVLTVRVLHGDDLLVVIQVMQEWREYSPAGIQLVVTDKVGVVALQGVQNQRLVRFGDLEVREATAVGQIEFRDNCLHRQTGKFGVHLDIDGLVGLHSNDELVSGNVLENARRDVLELDANLRLLLVKGWMQLVSRPGQAKTALRILTFSSLQNPGNTIPSLVLDICHHGAEGCTARVLGDGVVLLVCRLAAIERPSILADDDILGLNGVYRSQNAHLERREKKKKHQQLAHGKSQRSLCQPFHHGYPPRKTKSAAPWQVASTPAAGLDNRFSSLSNRDQLPLV